MNNNDNNTVVVIAGQWRLRLNYRCNVHSTATDRLCFLLLKEAIITLRPGAEGSGLGLATDVQLLANTLLVL